MTNENRIAGLFFLYQSRYQTPKHHYQVRLDFQLFLFPFQILYIIKPFISAEAERKKRQESEKKRHASPSPTPPPNPSLPPPPGLHPPRRPHLLPHHRHLATQPLPNLHSPDPIRAGMESFCGKNHSNFHARGPSSWGFEYLEFE